MGFFGSDSDGDETAAAAEGNGRTSPSIGPLAVLKSLLDGSAFDDSEEEEEMPEHERPVVFVTSRACVAENDANQERLRKRDHRVFVFIGCNAYEIPTIDIEEVSVRQLMVERQETLLETMKKMYLGLRDFDILRTLGAHDASITAAEASVGAGQGAFSTVRLALHHGTKELLAIKCMKKRDILNLKQVDYVTAERNTLLTMANRSPFIVQLEAIFQDEVYLCFVMEYISVSSQASSSSILIGGQGGELGLLITEGEEPYLSSSEGAFYFAQVLLAVECLHSYGFIHRDIKPENILIDGNGNAKLADLGFCKHIGHGSDRRSHTSLGTPEYMAPEMIQALGHAKPVDLWTLGVLLFEMLNGRPPFQSEDPFEVYQLILKLDYHCEDHVSGSGTELVKALMERNSDDRLGVDSIIHVKQHSFLSGINWHELEDCKKAPPIERAFDSNNPAEFFLSYPEFPLEQTDKSNELTHDEDMIFFEL